MNIIATKGTCRLCRFYYKGLSIDYNIQGRAALLRKEHCGIKWQKNSFPASALLLQGVQLPIFHRERISDFRIQGMSNFLPLDWIYFEKGNRK